MILKERPRMLSLLVGVLLIFIGMYIYRHPLFTPFLLRVVGGGMWLSGLLLIIEAVRFFPSVAVRNSWLVDGMLLSTIGVVLLLFAGCIGIKSFVIVLLFWFIYSAILQNWIAIKFLWPQEQSGVALVKWLGVALSVGVIVLSVRGLLSASLIHSFYTTLVTPLILLGLVKILYTFVIHSQE